MNDYERKILRHIGDFGCSVTSVFDPEGDNPPFTYSIGIARSTDAPELIVVGLESKISHWLVNEYLRRCRSGERFQPGVDYLGFLEGFSVRFVPVAREHRADYMRSACWLHEGPEFEALQLVWPTRSGAWPWDEDAPDWLADDQPLLSDEKA